MIKILSNVFFCAIFLLCLQPQSAKASHLAGVDLNVVHVGHDSLDLTYRMTLVVYGYCDPNINYYIALDHSATIEIKSASLNYSGTKQITLSATEEDTLDQLCTGSGLPNSCEAPTSLYAGYTRRIYSDTFLLPARATDFEFSYVTVSRSNASTNIDVQQYQALYISAGLNNLIRTGNGTPVYDALPVVSTCVNQAYHYINYPRDANGDSLISYSIPARDIDGTAISYLAGFSATAPFGSGILLAVDSSTGTASYTPQNTGRYVVSFRTDKYDRATHSLIGYTTREMQVPVYACANPIPVLSNVTNLINARLLQGARVEMTAGQTGSFDLIGTGGVALNITSNNAGLLAGSVLTESNGGTNNVRGTLTWTPPATAIGNYNVLFTLTDTACSMTAPVIVKDAIVVPVSVIRNTTSIVQTSRELFSVYPNPAGDRLYFSAKNVTATELEIRDMLGRVVMKDIAPNSTSVALGGIIEGTYLLRVVSPAGIYFAPFVKR